MTIRGRAEGREKSAEAEGREAEGVTMGGSGSFSLPDAVATDPEYDLLRVGRQKVEGGRSGPLGEGRSTASRSDVAGMTGFEPATFRVTAGAASPARRFPLVAARISLRERSFDSLRRDGQRINSWWPRARTASAWSVNHAGGRQSSAEPGCKEVFMASICDDKLVAEPVLAPSRGAHGQVFTWQWKGRGALLWK